MRWSTTVVVFCCYIEGGDVADGAFIVRQGPEDDVRLGEIGHPLVGQKLIHGRTP